MTEAEKLIFLIKKVLISLEKRGRMIKAMDGDEATKLDMTLKLLRDQEEFASILGTIELALR